MFAAYKPAYPYPRPLASTVIEMAQVQSYFMEHLPKLTDFGGETGYAKVVRFLEDLVFAALRLKQDGEEKRS